MIGARLKPPLKLWCMLSEMAKRAAEPPTRPSMVTGPPRRPVPHVAVQFVKFGIVGVSNTLLTFAVYTLLLKVFGVWYLLASAIGFIVGATNGFLLNRRWTFSDHVGDSLTPLRWAIVQGCGLGINEGMLYVFVGAAGLDKLVSQACATVIVTVTTFFANRAWTFRMHPHPEHVAVAADAD
jgi:putative flippase GtrA